MSNWHLYYSQHHAYIIYYTGHMSTLKSLAFSTIISCLIIEKQGIEMCLSCVYLAWLHIYLDWTVVATSQPRPVEIELQGPGIFRFVDLNYNLVSSTYVLTVEDILVEISFMQMRKRIGLGIIPWGTPDITGDQSQPAPLKTTRCLQFVQTFLLHIIRWSSIPWCCKFKSKRSCGT